MRTSRLTVRMTPDELAMLKELSERIGINQSDVVRMLVRREYAIAPQTPPPKKKPRQR